ncbi:MAG: DNA polymerase III subunit delta [bacterium]|nr:DNA polymerase III subunit delta [bacterium]
MTYTFCGNKDYIDIEVKKIESDFEVNNISTYDLNVSSMKDAISDINTFGLFGEKLVIVYNFDKMDGDELNKYLDNESDNTLVLVSYRALDSRKKQSKVLKEKTKYKELFDYDLTSFIKERLEDYNMGFMAINTLISYCNSDINRIYNELSKLKIYKIDEKEISLDDVKRLVKKGLDSSIFDLINCISFKDKNKIIRIYNELLEEGETPEKILYTLASNYRLLLQIKLKSKTCSDEEIKNYYKMHPYRLTKLKEQASNFSEEEILKILKTLSEIDISVKSGKMETDNGMILFFEKL